RSRRTTWSRCCSRCSSASCGHARASRPRSRRGDRARRRARGAAADIPARHRDRDRGARRHRGRRTGAPAAADGALRAAVARRRDDPVRPRRVAGPADDAGLGGRHPVAAQRAVRRRLRLRRRAAAEPEPGDLSPDRPEQAAGAARRAARRPSEAARAGALRDVNDALAVVVVTHNSAGELAALATSLAGQLEVDDEFVIVDNASSDGTVALARTLAERAVVIEAGANTGFAAACRLGVDASSAPLLCLLNPDTLVAAGALARLRAVAAEHPDWAAWQPVVMLPDGRINVAGGVVHYLGIGWAGQCGHDAAELAAGPYEVAFASGAALVARREIWRELDGARDPRLRVRQGCAQVVPARAKPLAHGAGHLPARAARPGRPGAAGGRVGTARGRS